MKDKIWLIGLLLIISTIAFYQQAPEAKEPIHRFALDIESGQTENPANLPIQVLEGPEDQQALMKINLDSHRTARIRVTYGADAPGEWSLNIGDSRSNNGYSGDGGDQTHDSEIQIVNSGMSVWGSDVMVDKEGRKLRQVDDFVLGGQTVEFEISDQKVKWKSPQAEGEFQSEFLFALAGQPDIEGPTNRDIFVSLNRVIAGPHRSGWGAASIEVELLP